MANKKYIKIKYKTESGWIEALGSGGGGEPSEYVKSATVVDHTIQFIDKHGNETTYNRDIIYSASEPENPVEDMIWLESGDESGSIGEPEEYIKKADVNNNILTLTKKDNSTVVFAPAEGKNWLLLNLDSDDLSRISNGEQLIRTVNDYNPINFKNDYFKAIVNTSGDLVGNMLHTKEPINHIYIDIKDYTTEEGTKILKNPDWNTSDVHTALTDIISSSGFDYHYYKTAVLWAGCSDTGEPILEAANVLETKNVVYVLDCSQQKWEINAEEKPGTADKREELDQEIFGTAYILVANIVTASTPMAYAILLCYKDSQAAYWDPSTGTIKWANIIAGKAYSVEFDSANNTERWILGDGVIEDTRPGHEGEMCGIEVNDFKKEHFLGTGFDFDSGLQSAKVVIDTNIKFKTPCRGDGSKELTKLVSWNEPFEIVGDTLKYEFIGRPAGYYLTTYKWKDEDGTVQINTDGEYVWDIDIQGNDVTVVIPAKALDTMIIEKSSQSVVGTDQQEYSSVRVYRHTFTILHDPDTAITWADGDYHLYCSFSGVNAQAGESSIEYIMFSDMNDQAVDWVLPASGKIGIVRSGTVATWFDIIRIKASYDDDKNRCLKVEYWDSNTNAVVTANVVTVNNIKNYIGRDFRSEIGSFVINNSSKTAAASDGK